jgi:hypothetical protein
MYAIGWGLIKKHIYCSCSSNVWIEEVASTKPRELFKVTQIPRHMLFRGGYGGGWVVAVER